MRELEEEEDTSQDGDWKNPMSDYERHRQRYYRETRAILTTNKSSSDEKFTFDRLVRLVQRSLKVRGGLN
jgi:hypothetical protein